MLISISRLVDSRAIPDCRWYSVRGLRFAEFGAKVRVVFSFPVAFVVLLNYID